MRRRFQTIGLSTLAICVLALPVIADALTIVQVLNFFNIFVGVMLTASIIVFMGGFGAYIARLGTWPNHRDQALKFMEWGVTMMFVLVVIVAIVQFFDRNPRIATAIAAFIVLVLVVILIAQVMKPKKKEEKK